MPRNTLSGASAAARDLGDDDERRVRRPVGKQWAVVVGISAYADRRLTLRYAHRDAGALYDFLLTPSGGGFTAERMLLLLDERATTADVIRALRSFLRDTEPDDLVLIYLACHGAPDDTGRARPLYLLTHDTDFDDIANTALPMDQIDWSLSRYVRAERIVIIADTCHSAGVSGARGGASDLDAAAVTRYLEELSQAAPGVAYLTSASEDQRSYEDEKWGGGHGAFTWFLLEGLGGAADGFGGRPRDGIVGIGELADYVTRQVSEATTQRQRPLIGGRGYDPELPMAVTGGRDARADLELARSLLEVGWLLDDPAPFLCAAQEASEAAVLAAAAGADLPEAHAVAFEALLAAGEPRRAVAEFGPALDRLAGDVPARARLLRGVAAAELGDPDAAQRLGEFAAAAPAGELAGWAAEYASWLRRDDGGTIRALLIGMGRYQRSELNLLGPPNDVALLADVLRTGYGVQHVVTLVDEAATRDAIVAALRELAALSSDRDVVLVSFGGHSNPQAELDQQFLITHDWADDDPLSGLTGRQVLDLVGAVPARARLLLLDTHGNAAFNAALAARPVATVLAASEPGGLAWEMQVRGRRHGAFSASFLEAWSSSGQLRALRYGELLAATNAAIERLGAQQVAVLLGDPQQVVLDVAFPAAGRWRRGHRDGSQPDRVTQLLVAAEAAAAGGRVADADVVLDQFAGLPDPERWAADATAARAAVAQLAAARSRALVLGCDPVQTAAARHRLEQAGIDEIVVIDPGPPAEPGVVIDEVRRIARHAAGQLGVVAVCGDVDAEVWDELVGPASMPNLVTVLDVAQVPLRAARGTRNLEEPPPPTWQNRAVTLFGQNGPDATPGRLWTTTGATYAEWAAAAGATASGQAADEPLFQHRTLLADMRREIHALRAAAAFVAVDRVRARLGRHQQADEQHPRGLLERGLGYAAAGRHADAIRYLRRARNVFENVGGYDLRVNDDGYTDTWLREAVYHFGRLLYEHGEPGDLNEAVAALQRAVGMAPDEPRILLHLGLAIRAQVQRQSLVQAHDLLRAYLRAGAPLGRTEEISVILADGRETPPVR